MNSILETLIALTITIAFLTAEHYLPWQRMFNLKERYPHVIIQHALGTLTIMIPFSVLLIVWKRYTELLCLWILICGAGVTVLISYGLDELIERKEANRIGDQVKKNA
jgi:hypothetical protein